MTTPASRSRSLTLDNLLEALRSPDPEIRGVAAILAQQPGTAAAILAQDPAAKAEFDRPRSGWPDRGPTPAATLAAYLRAQTPREFRR